MHNMEDIQALQNTVREINDGINRKLGQRTRLRALLTADLEPVSPESDDAVLNIVFIEDLIREYRSLEREIDADVDELIKAKEKLRRILGSDFMYKFPRETKLPRKHEPNPVDVMLYHRKRN